MASGGDSSGHDAVSCFFSDNCPALIATGAAAVTGLAAMSYMLASSGTPLSTDLDFNNQSVAVDGQPERRTSTLTPYSVNSDPEFRTVYSVLEKGKRESNNGPCLGARTGPNKEFEWLSYQEVIDKCLNFGSGLIHYGAVPSNNTFIGIFATNRPEWVIVDFGCQAYSMVPVPMYETLGVQACVFILKQCEIETVFTDVTSKTKSLLDMKTKHDLSLPKRIVSLEPVSEDLRAEGKKAGIDIIEFAQLLDIGKINAKTPTPPKPEDIHTVCYTSGTTGDPKGVILKQDAFFIMIQQLLVQVRAAYRPSSEDVHLSYLPLAHNFERGIQIMMFLHGARIGFFSRNIKLLTDDLKTLKPTIFPTVPRLLNRIYDGVHANVENSKIKSTLLRWALEGKQKDVDKRIFRKNSIWDKLLFNKVQDQLGGRVNAVITGSAPITSEVLNFLKCALGCVVVEGYGQTEAAAGLTLTIPGDPSVGHVGPPLPGCEVKLVDVPDMNYFAKDNYGEVCAKADFIMQGYYKAPEKTAEAIDEEGWLHTGDIGTWLPNGTLKIVDRKKNIFKLSQGEYIAVEKIENLYQGSPFVGQVYVEGNSLKPCLMAIVVPDALFLTKWAPNNGFPSDLKEFCQHKGAKDIILKDLIDQGKKAGLKSFEQVKDISLETEPFSVDNGLLTPTFKNKRPSLKKRYESIVDGLYQRHGL